MDSHVGLTEEQEARRRDGLRMLARIIARRYLDQAYGCAADREPAQGGDLERNRASKSNDGQMPDTEAAG